MHLDDVPDNRQTEAKTPGLARAARIGLPEALEDERQELVRDADARCRSPRTRRAGPRAAGASGHVPPAGVNLTALESRFQATCCSRLASPETGPTRGIHGRSRRRTPLASAAGRTVAMALLDDRGHLRRAGRSSVSLPVTIRETSRTSSTIWVSHFALRSSVTIAAVGLTARDDSRPQQLRVADDGVQRRAQFVREHGQELVLESIGLLRLVVEAGVLQRNRRPGSHAHRQPFVLLREDAWPRVAEEQPADGVAVGARDRDGEVAADRQVALRQAGSRPLRADARVHRQVGRRIGGPPRRVGPKRTAAGGSGQPAKGSVAAPESASTA